MWVCKYKDINPFNVFGEDSDDDSDIDLESNKKSKSKAKKSKKVRFDSTPDIKYFNTNALVTSINSKQKSFVDNTKASTLV